MNRRTGAAVSGTVLWVLCIAAGMAHSEESRCGMWIDAHSGEPLSFESLMEDLGAVDIVYIGEVHTLERHHRLQREIVEGLCRRNRTLILGLEQMEARGQRELERYGRGDISFDELARMTGWERQWGNYADYREVLETARACGVALYALNAKTGTVRTVGRTGLASLSGEDREGLSGLVFTADPLYERYIKTMLNVHAFARPENIHFMYEAQMLRDETIAQAIAGAIGAHGKARTAVVIAGSTHFAYGLGVPSRVRRRLGGLRDRIVLLSESGDLRLDPHQRHVARPIPLTHETMRFIQLPVADYLHVTAERQ